MGLFAFPLREGSSEVNAWASALRVWRRRSRWKSLIAVVVIIALMAAYHLLFSSRRLLDGGMIGLGAGLVGGMLGVSLGGLGFILRTRLFLDSAVTPLTTRDLVAAAQRTVLLPMVVVLILLSVGAGIAVPLSHEHLEEVTYRRYRVVYYRERVDRGLVNLGLTRLRSIPGEAIEISVTEPWEPNWPEGRPAELTGAVLSSHRAALIVSLVPVGLAGFWFLLGLLALFALWEKTVSPAKVVTLLITGLILFGNVLGLCLLGVIAASASGPFPLGPPPDHFQSAGEFWPRTALLCAAALGLAFILWSLGNAAWRKAARLPIDRIHETMRTRMAKRTKVTA